MIRRRYFLQGLAAVGVSLLPGLPLLPRLGLQSACAASPAALPVLMLHKVDDTPRYPEDLSTTQLARLLEYLWRNGFYPVNMSDILTGRVDAVVPKGLKPVGITADDAHRSVVFSRSDATHGEQRNARSLVSLLVDSVRPYGFAPRATLFLSAVGDDRYSREPAGYFGNNRSLHEILETLDAAPGIETGYHTVRHLRMGGMNAAQVLETLDEQIADFTRRGVVSRVRRILAYPYGVRPSEAGIAALKERGFLGAVLAFPGSNEAGYAALPPCLYDGVLRVDPFLVPRVGIGAHTYARKGTAPAGKPYVAIDPLEDFRKDVETALPHLYTSAGNV